MYLAPGSTLTARENRKNHVKTCKVYGTGWGRDEVGRVSVLASALSRAPNWVCVHVCVCVRWVLSQGECVWWNFPMGARLLLCCCARVGGGGERVLMGFVRLRGGEYDGGGGTLTDVGVAETPKPCRDAATPSIVYAR